MTVLDIRSARESTREPDREIRPPTDPPPDLPPPGSGIRSLAKRQRFMHHNRLVAIVATLNVAVLIFDSVGIDTMASMVLINLALAVLIRAQPVINVLFWLATRAPTSWPLSVRASLGKVYHFGGLHVGGAVCATAWFLALSGSLIYQALLGINRVSVPVLALTVSIVALLVAMITAAVPARRARATTGSNGSTASVVGPCCACSGRTVTC